MDEILTAIQNKLAEVPELKTKDENWGQLDLYSPEIPVQWPCALIALSGGQFTNIGRDLKATPINRQEGTLSFEITVAKLKLTNSSYKAPQLQKTQAFDIWKLVEKVHEVLHGWNPAGIGQLIRTAMGSVRRDDGVQEIRITYTAGIHNC